MASLARMRRSPLAVLARTVSVVGLATAMTSCSSGTPSATPLTTSAVSVTTSPDVNSSSSTGAAPTELAGPPAVTTPRPDWLGQRTLPTDADGFAEPADTPDELVGRAFASVDTLPPPTDADFHSTVEPLRGDPLARSSWNEDCPVAVSDLAYLTVSFWGFDELPHTGELIVKNTVADDVVTVFETLFDERYPIEEMRIVTDADIDAPPIGDTNNTSSFVCRVVQGTTVFSEHARGLAIDINPFHNPFLKDDLVLPELAGYYTDRSVAEDALIRDGDAVVGAFASIGWSWGGDWTSLKDYQHFSHNGQ